MAWVKRGSNSPQVHTSHTVVFFLDKCIIWGMEFDSLVNSINFINLGTTSTEWENAKKLTINKTDLIDKGTNKSLLRDGKFEMIERLQSELHEITQSKLEAKASKVAVVATQATTAAVFLVGVPTFLKAKFNLPLWQNITASSLLALTDISPTVGALFGIGVYPAARKIYGEIAKPFIVKHAQKSARAFLKGEGVI